MAQRLLSISTATTTRKLVSPPSPSSLCTSIMMYSQNREHDDHPIGERARSTADEFMRVAKEKEESLSKSAKDTWETVKEAVSGDDDDSKPEKAKHEYKETIEKGKE